MSQLSPPPNLRTLDTARSSIAGSVAAQLRAEAMARRSGWAPYPPQPKQAEFLAATEREVLFGGQGGGGKSVALLMAALQHFDVPRYSALVLRRSYTDLSQPGALMDLAGEWLRSTPAKWNSNERTWTSPADATLTFGYLETDSDRFRYAGAAFQFIGFDELTTFNELPYRFLFSRLRKPVGLPVPLRMRATANPGGIGHAWVKAYFIDPHDDPDRRFIPAAIDDNPALDAEEYRRSLAKMDALTRAQIEYGDWEATTLGTKFLRDWFTQPGRIVDAAPANIDRVRYWDLAATEPRLRRGRMLDPDWTVGALVGRQAGVYYLLDLVRMRGTPLEVEHTIKATAQADGRYVPVYIEQEPGSSGVITIDHYARTVLDGYDFHGLRATGNKELRANPLSAAAEKGNFRLVRADWLTTFLDELTAFPHASHDDQVDAVSGAYTQLVQRQATDAYHAAVGPPRPPLPKFMQERHAMQALRHT